MIRKELFNCSSGVPWTGERWIVRETSLSIQVITLCSCLKWESREARGYIFNHIKWHLFVHKTSSIRLISPDDPIRWGDSANAFRFLQVRDVCSDACQGREGTRGREVGLLRSGCTHSAGLFACNTGSSDGKASACRAGDLGSMPEPGRSPGEGHGYPLQHSCLENPMDRGAWRAAVHGGAESPRDWVTHTLTFHWRWRTASPARPTSNRELPLFVPKDDWVQNVA